MQRRQRTLLAAGIAAAVTVAAVVVGTMLWVTQCDLSESPMEGNAADALRQAIQELPPYPSASGSKDPAWLGAYSPGWIDSCGTSLDLVRNAARMRECDWKLDYSKGLGLYAETFARLNDVQRLSHAMVLRAEQRFGKKEETPAIQDLLALMTMGRRLASDTPTVHRMLGVGMEMMAMDGVGRYFLNHAEPAYLRAFRAELQKLPTPTPLSNAVLADKRSAMAIWEGAGQRPGRERNAVTDGLMSAGGAGIASQFDEAAAIMSLPYAQFPQRWSKFMSSLSGNAIAGDLFKPLQELRNAEAVIETRRVMLLAMIGILLNESNALESYKDPNGEQAFGLTRTADVGGSEAIVLSSKLIYKGKPLELSVSRRAK